MRVDVQQIAASESDAELVVVGLAKGEALGGAFADAPGAGDADGSAGALRLLHPGSPARLLVVGLGDPGVPDAERLRSAAAGAAREARRLKARTLAWQLPQSGDAEATAEAIVTGTILGLWRFAGYRSKKGDGDEETPLEVESLTLLTPAGVEDVAETARVAAEAQNRARDLVATPANFATPAFLAERAEAIAAGAGNVTIEVLDGDAIAAKGMGGIVAVSQGGPVDPRLIVLRYRGGDGPTLAMVGKGVTFDTGGISLKPGAGMSEMKMDMAGAAAVLEAFAAVAELGFAVDLMAVVASTENMPSGTAIKPGDVITQYDGTTVEVNNTDAEGRLILADALAYAIELGAERIVDLATLTGAVVMALGSTHAAVLANEDELAAAVVAAGAVSGELVWRLPLHREYRDLMKGTVADLSNLASKREAGTITAGEFLHEFVGDTPWAHLDIAGTAWDLGRAYAPKGASGFGVRLLVELARTSAS